MKRISVLMGIYNCADTLPRALDSLLEQTNKEWKCIMCDDGSSDNTYEVAKNYVDNFPDLFVLIKNDTNKGLNITLNRCLELADTEYIARMDGDDICAPTRFEKEISFLDNNQEYAFVSSWMDMFDENGLFRTIEYSETPSKESFVKGSQFCHAGCMIRTSAIKAVCGYTEDDKYIRVEDFDLWVKLYSNGFFGYNIQESLYSMLDDRNAFQRRNIKTRINESRVIRKACRELELNPVLYLYSLIPVIKYFVPKFIYRYYHKK